MINLTTAFDPKFTPLGHRSQICLFGEQNRRERYSIMTGVRKLYPLCWKFGLTKTSRRKICRSSKARRPGSTNPGFHSFTFLSLVTPEPSNGPINFWKLNVGCDIAPVVVQEASKFPIHFVLTPPDSNFRPIFETQACIFSLVCFNIKRSPSLQSWLLSRVPWLTSCAFTLV